MRRCTPITVKGKLIDVTTFLEIIHRMSEQDKYQYDIAVNTYNKMDAVIDNARIEKKKADRKVRKILSKYVD